MGKKWDYDVPGGIASRQREAWIETFIGHGSFRSVDCIASRQREAWIET